MRYGLIVAPATLPDLRPAPGTLDSDLVRSRLPQEDVAIEVAEIDPTTDVAEQIDHFFDARSEPVDAVLFYASSFVALAADGEVFLCLDPTNPDVGDSLRDVAGALRERFSGPVLFVLDCRHSPDESDPFKSATVASAIRSTLDPSTTGVEILVAVQPASPIFEDAASAFTRAFLAELDETDPSRKLTAADVYRRIRQSERLLGVVPCFAHTRGREPFVMIEGDGTPAEDRASIVDPNEMRASVVDAAELQAPPAGDAAEAPMDEAAPVRHDALLPPAQEDSFVEAKGEVSAAPLVADTPKTHDEVAAPPPPAAHAEAPSAPPQNPSAPPPEARAVAPSAPPPAAPSAPPPVAKSSPPPAAHDSAAPAAKVVLSDRPPPQPESALPKVMLSDRPPARAPSEPAPPGDNVKAPASSIEPPPGGDGARAGGKSGGSIRPSEAAPAAEAPAPEPPKEPTYADHVAQGDALASRDAEGALAEYKKALLLVQPSQKEERADVYVRIGQVKLLQDKRREAISNFDKATQLSPNHRGALEEMAKLSAEERDWRGVAQVEEKILSTIERPEDRFARLMEFGERWANVAYDIERARAAFQRAREIQPDNLDVLRKLVRLQEATGAAEEAFALRIEIADKTTDARARAEQYASLAKHCLEVLKDEDRALSFFDKALDADPKALEPLVTVASILAERQEWSELEATYRRMLTRADRIQENDIRGRLRWELNRRLAMLFRDHLEDSDAALNAFEKALVDRPEDLPTRQTAAELARELGRWDAARAHLQVCARLDPMVVQTYHDLFDVFQKLKRPDQAWAAASVTAQLGHADQRERFIYEEGRTEGPPKPTRALEEDGWDLLRDRARDLAVEGVLEAITKAATVAKLDELREKGRLPSLDPAAKQDPKKSTVSIVRSFAWASHLLGVPMPAVYLRDDAQVGLAAVLAEEPSVIAGAAVLRGKSLTELAFAAGRHLGYHFGAHRLLLYYPVIDDLAACFLAAVRIVMPSAKVPARMEKATSAMQTRIEPALDAKSRSALERAVVAFEAAGSRADLNAWVASVERCSTRAGYLLCNDLRTVATSLTAEGPGILTVEEKMVDLLCFTISEELHALREELGIAIEP